MWVIPEAIQRRSDYPILIEFELDFEDKDKFSLVFSNRFKRHDNVNTLKDMIEQSYSSSRTLTPASTSRADRGAGVHGVRLHEQLSERGGEYHHQGSQPGV